MPLKDEDGSVGKVLAVHTGALDSFPQQLHKTVDILV